MRFQVGDFVRFSSKIMLENSHLALTGDRAIIVGFSEDRKIARVVWEDGDAGQYPTNKLVKTERYAVGKAVRAPGKPLRDKGHKPVSAPKRVIPDPLPTATPDNYSVSGLTVKWFVPSQTEFTKAGNPKMIPMQMQKIHVKCQRSGTMWVYTGTRRGGQWQYTDGRIKALGLKDKAMSEKQFRLELSKYATNPVGVWVGVTETIMGPADYRALYQTDAAA